MTDCHYQIPNQVSFQKLGGRMVLLDLEKGHYFELNESGTVILEQLLDRQSAQHAATTLVNRFALTVGQAKQDVASLLSQLIESGLIEAVKDG